MAQRLTGRNLALLGFLGAIWGTAFMFISLGVDVGRAFHHVPILFAAYRFDLAGAALLAIAIIRFRLRRRRDATAPASAMLPSTRAQWIAVGVAAVLNVGAYHAFLFWGQRYTTEVVASVIVGLNPIITTVLSTWLLTDERVGWHGIVGLALGFAGIVVLAALKGGSLLDARGIGELMIALAVASWSLGSILVRRTKHGMDVFAFTSWHMLLGAAILHIASLGLENGRQPTWDAPGVISLVYLAIVSSSLGFIVYFTLLERIGPIRSNLVSHIAPIFATLAGVIVLHTAFEWRALAAFLLIASGFMLVARPTRA